MSRESEIADYLRADYVLMAILTGGVYTNEEAGVEGLRRGEHSPTKDAFDPATGFLLPCAVVRQRANAPFGGLRDQRLKQTSASQIVEIYFYQDRGHDIADTARDRVYELLEGHPLAQTWPAIWVFDTAPTPDAGPVKNSTVFRSDYQVVSIKRPST